MNKPLPDDETLPITAARTMALMTLAMSIGFVLMLFFVFLNGLFHGAMLWAVSALMLMMALISSLVALKRLMVKMRCPHCHQPFFNRVTQLFAPAKYCAACKTPLQADES